MKESLCLPFAFIRFSPVLYLTSFIETPSPFSIKMLSLVPILIGHTGTALS